MKELKVIGLMSGTSLDGLDIALCKFYGDSNHIKYEILNTATIPYVDEWEENLKNAHLLKSDELLMLNSQFGQYQGELVNAFLKEQKINKGEVDLIGAHGHTIFHQPENQFTYQLGDGAKLSHITRIPVICDFRSQDVALNGQGAPLVPIGDKLLFGAYKYCLNIGGIANISFEENKKRLAWDICPANMVLNYFAQKLNQPFDKNGKIAASGMINKELLSKLNSLDFYSLPPPKTLGREWVFSRLLPLLESGKMNEADVLSTFSEHIAIQIAEALVGNRDDQVLITGGGAYNIDLVERIRKYSRISVNIPDNIVVEFKEALIFALLAYLKWNGENNILSSVTGAFKDHSSGLLYNC
jgi:anhydro-N-acetylmuramic acid kinase